MFSWVEEFSVNNYKFSALVLVTTLSLPALFKTRRDVNWKPDANHFSPSNAFHN